LNTSINRYTTAFAPASVPQMTQYDAGVEPPQQDIPPVSAIQDDDVPARRLLAHDMEYLVWDDDGDRAVPPPD
jgi:hypothetical protein